MVGANLAFFRIARANHRAAIDFDGDFRAMRVFEFAEFSLDSHSAIGSDVYFDAGRHWNRFFTYTGHDWLSAIGFRPSANPLSAFLADSRELIVDSYFLPHFTQ